MSSIFGEETENLGFFNNEDEGFQVGEIGEQGRIKKHTRPQVFSGEHEVLSASLLSLISSMKKSFLQEETDSSVVRIVCLQSSPAEMFLLRRFHDTILIGSGLGKISVLDSQYTTFPDFRLPFAERDRIRAWILPEEQISAQEFLPLLEILNYPEIYTHKSNIISLQSELPENIMARVRFVDLFSSKSDHCVISGLRFQKCVFGSQMCVGLSVEQRSLVFSHRSNLSSGQYFGSNDLLFWSDLKIDDGQVIELRNGEIKNHSMKFTFDTFYRDQKSFGVLSGYVFSDRKILATSGVLIFTFEEDIRARTIVGNIFIDSRGFVHAHESLKIHKKILKAIRIIYEQTLEKNPHIDRTTLIQTLKKELQKYCFFLTGKAPIIMPIFLDKHM